MKDVAGEGSASPFSVLLEPGKPFWLGLPCPGTEMIGAGSRLPLMCLGKLQVWSGAGGFFTVKDKDLLMHAVQSLLPSVEAGTARL